MVGKGVVNAQCLDAPCMICKLLIGRGPWRTNSAPLHAALRRCARTEQEQLPARGQQRGGARHERGAVVDMVQDQ